MFKFIKYHLLYLLNDLWFILVVIMALISSCLFFYLGNGFSSNLLRLLEVKDYLREFEQEAFLICNIVLSIWVIGASKEIFCFKEPNIMLINKKKYIHSKIIAYLIYYLFITLLLYGVYQIIMVLLYGFRPFNYLFLSHLLINVSLIHLIVVLVSGRNKNIFLTMIYIIVFLIINTLISTSYSKLELLTVFIPLQTLNYPIKGYVHIILVLLLLYFASYFKHFTYYE